MPRFTLPFDLQRHAGGSTVRRLLLPPTLVATLLAAAGPQYHTQATPSNPLNAAISALSTLQSFQVDSTGSSTEKPPALEKVQVVVTNHGSGRQVHLIEGMRPSGAGDTTTVEYVAAGGTVCERSAFSTPLPLTGAFHCTGQPATAQSLAEAALPIANLIGATARVSIQPTTGKVIGGIACQGYRFRAQSKVGVSSGTLYVAQTSDRPCEQDAVTVGPAIGPSNGTATATVTSVTVWHHFNDARLTTPKGVLPASAFSFSVRPLVAHPGQSVTLSGVTQGESHMLPPIMQLAATSTHTVHRPNDVQCGGTAKEPLAYGLVGTAGPYRQKSPASGTPWTLTFRVPQSLNSTSSSGKDVLIATPPGTYRLIATFGPSDFCPAQLPMQSNPYAVVATITIAK